MDVTALQGLAVQQALFQQQMGVSLLRQAAAADQQAVALLDSAIQPAAPPNPAGGRGSLLDISV